MSYLPSPSHQRLLVVATLIFTISAVTEVAGAAPVRGISSRLCAAVNFSNPKYGENMDALAKKANLPRGYWSRYHAEVVTSLCSGKRSAIKEMIDRGEVTAAEAEGLRQALTDPLTRSDEGRSSGSSRQRSEDPGQGNTSRLCAAVDFNNPNYGENMDALAKKANLPRGYWSRYHEEVVKSLCSGKRSTIRGMIDRGEVTAAEAEGLRQALGIRQGSTERPTRSDKGRSYGFSKQRFEDMGLCSACADNVAQWYSQRPASRCGKLAKHALEGDPDAIRELQEFPQYCTWNYE